MNSLLTRTAITCLAISVLAMPSMAQERVTRDAPKGSVVAYPWVFDGGNETSKSLAVATVEGIANKANYYSIPGPKARSAWSASHLPMPSYGHMPSKSSLRIYARTAHASKVLYGSVSWHTRSIWVNMGPKTISTATVNAYVYDLKSNKISFHRKNVYGRSDEKSNGYKLAADVVFTPIVTAVSGGPSTPHEQRAVQIALGNAYSPWVNR